MRGTYAYFSRYFTLKGESPERVSFLTENALRLASRLEHVSGRTRVAEALDSGASFATPARDRKWNQFVSIFSGTRQKGRPLDVEYMHTMYDFAHELIHGIEQLSVEPDSVLTPEQIRSKKVYQAVNLASMELTVEEKTEYLKYLMRAVAPNKAAAESFNFKGMIYDRAQYEAQISPIYTNVDSEFIADVAGIMALGVANPTSGAHARNLADVLLFSNETTKEFADGFYRDLTHISQGVKEYMGRWLKFEGKASRVKPVYEAIDQLEKNVPQLFRAKEAADASVNAFLATMERKDATPISPPPVASWDGLLQATYGYPPHGGRFERFVERGRDRYVAEEAGVVWGTHSLV